MNHTIYFAITLYLGYYHLQTRSRQAPRFVSGFTQALEISPPLLDRPFSSAGESGSAQQGPEFRVVLDIRRVLRRQAGILPTSRE